MKCNCFSIVTTSLNQGQFLEDTVNSVLAQRGNTYVDYIVMDGGSKDNSVEVLESIESTLKEKCHVINREGLSFYINKQGDDFIGCRGLSFRWFSDKDNGQVDALKKGFCLAKGNILCWLNSDDYYLSDNVFERVITLFNEDSSLDVVTGDGLLVDINGNELNRHHVDHIHLKELLFLDYHIFQPSTFFKKDSGTKERLSEKFVCAFDADFFINMIKSGKKWKKVDIVFSAFRIYDQIKTEKFRVKRFFEQIRISLKYSRNYFYLFVSVGYRFVSILLRPFLGKYLFFRRMDTIVYKFSYLIITGKPGRR